MHKHKHKNTSSPIVNQQASSAVCVMLWDGILLLAVTVRRSRIPPGSIPAFRSRLSSRTNHSYSYRYLNTTCNGRTISDLLNLTPRCT